MIQIGIWCVGALSLLNLVLIILALKRIADSRKENSLQAIQDELRSIREEVSRSEKRLETKFEKGMRPRPRH